MAKVKSSETPHYELLYIVSNKYSEDELAPIMDNIRKIINGAGGNITFSEEWGKKRLAYPINHYTHGYYILLEFDLDGNKLNKVNQSIRLMNEILRFQVVKKKVKTIAQIKADQKIAEKIAAKEAKEKEAKADDKKDKEKVDLKKLDEKLDKILETDDLL